MKKTSIKKTNQVLSVLLSSCMLLSATTAASATLVTDTTQNEQIQTNLPQPWHAKIMQNILKLSVQKNLVLSNRIFCTSAKTIRSRLLTYLSMESVKAGNTTFQIPFDRQQLADYLNVDRTALSKELGKMRTDGILDFYKNKFTLRSF